MKKYRLLFSVYEKHQAHRLSSIQEVVELVSDTLYSSYCAGMKIIPEARLPIYQKFSMAHKVTWHLRVLRQLKCLPALKTSRKSQNYTDMTLLILIC